jgi:MYXO-CTERM domain-containing protein
MRFAKVFSRLVGAAAAVALSGALTSSASAARVYDFVAQESSFSVAPDSGAFNVNIFFRERLTETGDTSLLVSEDGLFSFGVLTERVSPEPIDPALIVDADTFRGSATARGFELDNEDLNPDGSSALMSGATFDEELNQNIITVSSTDRRILVGTLKVEPGSLPGQVTTFELSDPQDTGDTQTYASETLLDPDIVTNQFTVTTTPEPGGIALVAAAGLILLGRRRRSVG